MLEELSPLSSFDEQTVNSCPALTALATCTGNCLHCIQDAGIGLFEPAGDRCMYVVSTDNCEVHKFNGDCAIERWARNCKSNVVRCCVGASQHAIRRERLPFAFVSVYNNLLAALQQQLIRQCTKPDRGALGDCYAFGVRSLDGLRDSHHRVMTLRLHVILAARILWMPNSISRVYDWVPIMPLSPDGIYRLGKFLEHKSRMCQILNYDIVADCGPPADFYTYNHDGSYPWLGEGQTFGPENHECRFLEPEQPHGGTARGRMSRRNTATQHALNETAILCFVREKLVVTTKQVANRMGAEKKAVNRILYSLMDLGAVHKILDTPPTWASTDESGWGKVARTECSNMDCSEARVTEQDIDAGRVRIEEPAEIDRGDHRSSPENPITGFSVHPTQVTGQPHVVGDTSYLSEAHKVDLRGGEAWLDYRDSVNESGHKEMRSALEEEAKQNLEQSEFSGCAPKEARAHCSSWESVPESGNIPGVYVAKPTIGNALKAMKDRHFKVASGVGEMTKVGKKHVQRACSMLKQVLMESCVDSGALALAYDILETMPTEFKSGKWTEERFLTALSKEKPRMIITSGDEGVARHILDAGREFGRRMGEILRNYDYVSSMDFGAFDGSCTKECRDLIENDIIVSMFMKIMSLEGPESLLAAAVRDRIKNKCSILVKNVVKAVIFDMIRESGDRGTSILNFLTNLCIFFANLSLVLERKGIRESAIRKIVMDSIRGGKLANLMGEGDDGLQAFAEALIRMIGTKFEFGEAWCKGMLLGPDADEANDSFVESLERERQCFLAEGKAPLMMMKSLERETGIAVADQEMAIKLWDWAPAMSKQ
ncbi:ACS [Symbiodinium sp. CCMP2592]|nr:ACS [Symbiodinium sp. CCMP2592]